MGLGTELLLKGHRGLGLYVAKVMMERTGGDVELISPGRCFSQKELLLMKFQPFELSEDDYTKFGIKFPSN
jgi:hypothetical protein